MTFLNTAQPKPKQGFTIIELLLATIVFSVVLLVMSTTFIQISRLYYKGINMASAQDDTRIALTDMGNDIEFASAAPASLSADYLHSPTGSFCIGAHLYAYGIGTQVGSVPNAGLYRQGVNSGTCPPSINPAKPVDQLLGNGMQLNKLSLTCNGGVCNIEARVISYGSDPSGLFQTSMAAYKSPPLNPSLAPDAACTGPIASSQFCAEVDYQRTVLQSP